jgi:hypothetical protein
MTLKQCQNNIDYLPMFNLLKKNLNDQNEILYLFNNHYITPPHS